MTSTVDWAGVPLPDLGEPELAPFWAGCRAGELRVPRCLGCARDLWPPRAACRHCGTLDREWRPVAGHGKLFTWTVVAHTPIAGFAAAVPFPVGVIELDGLSGVRMVGRVLAVPAELHVADPVRVGFEQVSADVWLPVWHVAGPFEVRR